MRRPGQHRARLGQMEVIQSLYHVINLLLDPRQIFLV